MTKRTTCEGANHGSDGHAQHGWRHHGREVANHGHHRVGVGLCWSIGASRTESICHVGEQWAQVLQRAVSPDGTCGGEELGLVVCCWQIADLANVHGRNVGESVVGKSHRGIRLRVWIVACGTEIGELGGEVPIECPLLGHGPHHVVEEGHAAEWIGCSIAKGQIVRHGLRLGAVSLKYMADDTNWGDTLKVAPVPVVDIPELDVSVYADAFQDSAHIAEVTSSFLRSATERGDTHVLLVSTAMVYGAWPNSPTPISERQPVRAVPRFAFANACATAEALVDSWRREVPGRAATILRPVPVVEPRRPSALVQALADAVASEVAGTDMTAQFLHVDDLAEAKRIVHQLQPDGIFNVAPNGAIVGERLKELSPHAFSLSLPASVREFVDAVRWRFSKGPIPPGLREYTRHSWCVSNEKISALGWTAKYSNEEAFVEGTTGSWYSSLSAQRRQELALGAAGVGVVMTLLLLRRLVKRARR